MITAVLASVLLMQVQQDAQPRTQPPDCARLRAVDPPARGVAGLCDAEDAMRRARSAPAASGERAALWRAAAEGYQRSADVLQSTELRLHALEMLAGVYDDTRLDDAAAVERALRALATIDVGTSTPLMRLAKFQESQKRFESAEQTFYGARQQYPDGLELLREMSRFFARRLLTLAPRKTRQVEGEEISPPATETTNKPPCAQGTFKTPGRGAADLCMAGEEMLLAARAEKNSPEKKTHLNTAANYYRKAATDLRDVDEQIHAYESLATIYSSANLNLPAEAEPIVRELIALMPASAAPVIRLATVQEALTQIDAAERTLIGARQQFPDELDVLRALSRFYARLATAAATTLSRAERAAEVPRPPGLPDQDGYYSIGGHVAPPKKIASPAIVFPDEAQAVELEGIVILELRVDEAGRVADVRVVRSIPMLDDAAVAAAKQWRFAPTVIDGRPVPVRITATQNFTIQK